MVTEAKIGYGATFKWGGDFVAELTRVGPVSLVVSKQDATTLASPDKYKDILPGLIDPGDIELEGYFRPDDTAQAALLADMNSRTKRGFIIAFPTDLSTTTWAGDAYCTGFVAGDLTAEGIIPFSATLSIVGKPILGVLASAGLTTPWFAISESAVITPAPAADVYTYVATVATGITSVTFTPTAATGVITVNGNVVASGDPVTIALAPAGVVVLITCVQKDTNKSPKTYKIYLTRLLP